MYIKHSNNLINKIYKSILIGDTVIFSKKVRTVFLFFFEKFKEDKNIQFLESLMDLFILINDFLSLAKIQEAIL